MAKRGRPATGQMPAMTIRLPAGWVRQLERIGDRRTVIREIVGAALTARQIKTGDDGIIPIDTDTAKAFLELYHYSGAIPTGRNQCFGWFIAGQLYAVACYGIGINHGQAAYLAKATGRPVTRENLIELRRLARSEPVRPDAPLSRFLATVHVPV